MANTDLLELSLVRASELIRAREISPVELTAAVLDQIERLNPTLNAFTTLAPREEALRAARAAEEEIARNGPRSALHGIPVSVKDLIDTAGLRTTYGSGMFREHVPAEDGSMPERLRALGAVLTGKTATHELGMGMTTNNFFYGPTRNPWNLEHVPGGSSGGAGAAAAALMGPLHVGTDGGGSIRFPAAFCGVVGHKPTLGLLSTRGQLGGTGTSYSVPGPLARSVRDAALASQLLAGFDPAYLYSLPHPVPDLQCDLDAGDARDVAQRDPFISVLGEQLFRCIQDAQLGGAMVQCRGFALLHEVRILACMRPRCTCRCCVLACCIATVRMPPVPGGWV